LERREGINGIEGRDEEGMENWNLKLEEISSAFFTSLSFSVFLSISSVIWCGCVRRTEANHNRYRRVERFLFFFWSSAWVWNTHYCLQKGLEWTS
jgi:hypothetical protein